MMSVLDVIYWADSFCPCLFVVTFWSCCLFEIIHAFYTSTVVLFPSVVPFWCVRCARCANAIWTVWLKKNKQAAVCHTLYIKNQQKYRTPNRSYTVSFRKPQDITNELTVSFISVLWILLALLFQVNLDFSQILYFLGHFFFFFLLCKVAHSKRLARNEEGDRERGMTCKIKVSGWTWTDNMQNLKPLDHKDDHGYWIFWQTYSNMSWIL